MVADLFLACADATGALIATEAVSDAWSRYSALNGYTVAGLSGHLARGVLTVEQYLDRPAPPEDSYVTDAAGYLTTVLGAHDPVDSEFHRAVRLRGAATSADGAGPLADQVHTVAQRLRERLEEAALDQPIEVLDGVTLPLAEYLKTRLVELVVHLDDLAVSIGWPRPDGVPDRAYAVVACVLGQVAATRVGGLDTVRSLARRERHPDAVRAL